KAYLATVASSFFHWACEDRRPAAGRRSTRGARVCAAQSLGGCAVVGDPIGEVDEGATVVGGLPASLDHEPPGATVAPPHTMRDDRYLRLLLILLISAAFFEGYDSSILA